MISENSIKTKFIVDVLKQQTGIFYQRSIERLNKYLNQGSGRTLKALSNPDYSITASGERFQVVAHITKQLRFQDMGVRKIYTKPMHAVMMGRVKANLHYRFTEEIREKIINELQESLS